MNKKEIEELKNLLSMNEGEIREIKYCIKKMTKEEIISRNSMNKKEIKNLEDLFESAMFQGVVAESIISASREASNEDLKELKAWIQERRKEGRKAQIWHEMIEEYQTRNKSIFDLC